ncbi:hypothetical protein ACA910_004056 [Epithemia clementina (nom. ined.)]
MTDKTTSFLWCGFAVVATTSNAFHAPRRSTTWTLTSRTVVKHPIRNYSPALVSSLKESLDNSVVWNENEASNEGFEEWASSLATTEPTAFHISNLTSLDGGGSFQAASAREVLEVPVVVISPEIIHQANSSIVGSETDFSSEPLYERSNDYVTDTVSAILAVSEAAVAEAEASFPASLKTFPDNKIHEDPLPKVLPEFSSVDEDFPSLDGAVVDKDDNSNKVEAPTLSRIIQFAIPATGVWLCSPLLSLIDTSTVGLLSGTTQQAALNPAVAVTEYTALLIAFLYTGTTNLIAGAREKDRRLEGSPRTTKNFIGSLQLSTYVGAGMGVTLFALAGVLVRTILGKGSFDPAVFDAAVRYVRIRALGFPAAAMIGTAQAACLGMQDAKSPLYVLLAAAIVNFCGDMLFVGNSNPLIGGAAGAAWATTFSQYAAVCLFIRWLCFKPVTRRGANNKNARILNISRSILAVMRKPTRAVSDSIVTSNASMGTGFLAIAIKLLNRMGRSVRSKVPYRKTEELSQKKPAFSTRGFLMGRVKTRDLIKLPSRDIIREFSPYVLPVTSTQFGRVSCYVAMSHVVSSSLGTLAMAAQQVILSFFYSITPIADSLGLTAQSFIPPIAEKSPSKDRAVALRQTMVNLSKIGVLVGAIMVMAMSAIPFMSRFSTSDPQVIAEVATTIPFLAAASLVHPFVTGFEGLLLGRKDLGFVGKMYTCWFFIVPFFMLRLKDAARAGQSIGLSSVWNVFLFYQISRCATWVGRAVVLQRKTDKEAKQIK